MDYEFDLPFPPSFNHHWRTFRNIQTISKRGVKFRVDVINKMKEIGLHSENIDSRLHVTVELYPPCNRKRDIDNYVKSLLDALTHSNFWVDDEQVDSLYIKRMEKVKGGKVTVKVKVNAP